jgi:hypothetical protein
LKRYLLYIIFILLSILSGYSQTARVTVTRGSRVQFVFESYNDIANGKTLGSGSTGYTTINVYYRNPAASATWYLNIRSNYAAFQPDYGTTTLPLSYMTMEVYLDGGYINDYTLTSTDQEIATATGDYTAGVNHAVTVTYHFAESGELMGVNSDNFSTDLIITLHD